MYYFVLTSNTVLPRFGQCRSPGRPLCTVTWHDRQLNLTLGASSPLRYKQFGRGWSTSENNCLVSYLLCWRRHVSANVGRLQVTKMYIQENYTQYLRVGVASRSAKL